ncbi:hypothetical protein HY993_02075 [Candidatus Micrarchaeota archaeon]|nr:hypothetical protein [Candidatus Micrarchaeota archaeon]
MDRPKLIEVRKKQILEKQPPGPPDWEVVETNETPSEGGSRLEPIEAKKLKKTLAQRIKSFFRL